MKKSVLRFTLIFFYLLCGWTEIFAADVTDVLTYSAFTATSTAYTTFSDVTFTSAAVYAGNTAAGYSSIQMRSDNSKAASGIVTTASGGSLKKISVAWNSNNATTDRTLEIYGKTTPYLSADDLYSSTEADKGTLICSISKNDNTEHTLPEGYTYFGIKSKSGALYLDKITVVWDADSAPIDEPTTPSYTVGTATYVFNTSEGIAALGISEPASGQNENLSNDPYTVGPVQLVANHTSGYSPRVFKSSSSELSFRMFSNGASTITISATGNCHLSAITFTVPSSGNSMTYLSPSSGTLSGSSTNYVWKPADNETTSVKFTAVPNNGSNVTVIINTIAVDYDAYVTVTDFASMKSLASGTPVWLSLSENNAGIVEYVHSATGEAFIRDTTGALDFKNVLPNDRGWHTAVDGALIGKIAGKYVNENGIPQFVSIDGQSSAHRMLCLDNYEMASPQPITLAQLAGTEKRADYVSLTGVTLKKLSDNYYVTDGTTHVQIENRFGLESITLPSSVTGSRYTVKGIVGVNDTSESSLYLTALTKESTELLLNENQVNTTLLAAAENENVDLTLTRKLTTGVWNTLCLPFDLPSASDYLGNVRIAAFTGYDSGANVLEFTSVNDISAGTPYLILPNEELNSDLTMTSVQVSSTLHPVKYGNYEFVPVFDPTELQKDDRTTLFLGTGNTLFYPSVTAEMKAFRAFFKVSAPLAPASVMIDGTTTGISAVDISTSATSGKFYDMNGRYIGSLENLFERGIYVTEGSKIIIK